MMPFEEFRKEVIQMLKQNIKDEEYINAIEYNIKEYYESEKIVNKILDRDQISPSSYVLGIIYLYPDLP